ncbi:MAG: transcription termination factor Rho [Planctomycetota bacterium]|nr:MAG: transcription termination factor Rho [Planctomycetota bacterium]
MRCVGWPPPIAARVRHLQYGARTHMAKPKTASKSADVVEGVLELTKSGPAYLRSLTRHLVPSDRDPVVSHEQVRKFALRGGELLSGPVQRDRKRGFKLARIEAINGVKSEAWTPPTPLQETTAIDPDERLHFDTPGGPLSMRIVELFTPIGRGQRGLIVAPPRTGKTMLLQQIAHGLAVNHPDVYMIVLLIDERPEEVTDMRRNVHGEVIASSNDLDVASHVRVARLAVERARRLTESGRDIVILLDSITRLGRAFNNFVKGSGRTMTGGLDINALQEPKKIFGSARNVEGGGSLTIIATALVDTGSRADEFIFQEFKGTGNMELVLDRELANLRVWPAVNLTQSGTRKEEKLLSEDELNKQHKLRRALSDLPPAKQITTLLERMKPHDDLRSYLNSLRS